MNYAKLYAILCGAISDALDHLPLIVENESARQILQRALLKSEEYYILHFGEDDTKK